MGQFNFPPMFQKVKLIDLNLVQSNHEQAHIMEEKLRNNLEPDLL